MARALIIGDLAWDVKAYLKEDIKVGRNLLVRRMTMSPGGVAGNMAWYIRQLGHEAEVAGAVGDDPLGEALLRDLRESGVGVGLVKVLRGPTGLFFVAIDRAGERTMIGDRGVNARLQLTKEEIESARPSWIHFSGYLLLNRGGGRLLRAAMEAAHDLGVPFSVDLEGAAEVRRRISLRGAYVFCNEGLCEERLREGARVAVIKAGERGCYLERLGTVVQFWARKVRPRDLTGAGDAFNAAFISAMLYGRGEEEACRLANLLAGHKVSRAGTRVAVPARLRSLFPEPSHDIH